MRRNGFVIVVLVLAGGVWFVSGVERRIRDAQDEGLILETTRRGWVWPADLVDAWQQGQDHCFIDLQHGRLYAIDRIGAIAAVEVRRNILGIPDWNLTGEPDPDGNRIVWSDGTIWYRVRATWTASR